MRAIPRNQKIHTVMGHLFRKESSRKKAVKSDCWEGRMKAQEGQKWVNGEGSGGTWAVLGAQSWAAGGSPSKAGAQYTEGLTVSGRKPSQAVSRRVW